MNSIAPLPLIKATLVDALISNKEIHLSSVRGIMRSILHYLHDVRPSVAGSRHVVGWFSTLVGDLSVLAYVCVARSNERFQSAYSLHTFITSQMTPEFLQKHIDDINDLVLVAPKGICIPAHAAEITDVLLNHGWGRFDGWWALVNSNPSSYGKE